jgi:hypothetical protein
MGSEPEWKQQCHAANPHRPPRPLEAAQHAWTDETSLLKINKFKKIMVWRT